MCRVLSGPVRLDRSLRIDLRDSPSQARHLRCPGVPRAAQKPGTLRLFRAPDSSPTLAPGGLLATSLFLKFHVRAPASGQLLAPTQLPGSAEPLVASGVPVWWRAGVPLRIGCWRPPSVLHTSLLPGTMACHHEEEATPSGFTGERPSQRTNCIMENRPKSPTAATKYLRTAMCVAEGKARFQILFSNGFLQFNFTVSRNS